MTVTESTADTATDEPVEHDRSEASDASEAEVVDDVLVEEISIDGMCGVY